MKSQFENTPLFMVARAIEKAGNVSNLADETGIGESTVYFWLNMEHGPSRSSMEALKRFLSKSDAPAAPAIRRTPQKAPIPSSALEDMFPLRVFLVRHALSRSGQRIIFAETGDGEQVFMPPIVADRAFAVYGDNGVLPYDTTMDIIAYKDRSGRSAYIAFAVQE